MKNAKTIDNNALNELKSELIKVHNQDSPYKIVLLCKILLYLPKF